MPTNVLILLLLLAILVALAAFPPTRLFFLDRFDRLRQRFRRPPPPSTGVTIINGDGEEIAMPIRAPGRWNGRLEGVAQRQRLLAVLLVLVLGLLAYWQLPRMLQRPTDRFIVLVAPFQERDDTVTQTGRSVAAELVEMLPAASNGRVVARLIDAPPADRASALALMNSQNADALVWGQITSGGRLDEQSLLPLLAYRPTGTFAPKAWEGYNGRFAVPIFYQLTATTETPINGQAVLPELLGALADYGSGQVDSAFTGLDMLMANYPALVSTLPRILRGNIFWARGEFTLAVDEYDQALNSLPDGANDSQRALLLNNQGAIWQDAARQEQNAGNQAAAQERQAAAQDRFRRAGEALNLLPEGNRDFGELRYNLGLDKLRAGQAAEAMAELQVARNLLPPSTPLLLALSEAYQMNGQFEQAEITLNAAIQQIGADAAATVPNLSNLTSSRLRAATQQQRGLLRLAQLLPGHGPLLWEMQADPTLPAQPLGTIRSDLAQSVAETERLTQGWSRRSAAEDAGNYQVAGRIAVEQFRRADTQLRERARWQAILDIAIWRAQGAPRPQGIAALWTSLVGDRSPLGQARTRLETLLESRPNDADAAFFLGSTKLFQGERSEAATQFDQAASVAPQRPEPVYGQALAALPEDSARAAPEDSARAIDLLTKAIALDGRYFPARQQLAEIAQANQDWDRVIEQRRWLAQQRPDVQNRLDLAKALGMRGPAEQLEAEQVLLALANDPQLDSDNRIRALIALSQLYQSNGKPDAARDALAAAQGIAPQNADVAYETGQVLLSQGRVPEATAQFQKAVAANPRHIQAHLKLAQIYGPQDERTAAEYQAALDAGANDPAVLKGIGAVLLEIGQYEPAATAYQRAITEVSRDSQQTEADAELYHKLAVAQFHLGELDRAQENEQKALALRPGGYPEALVGLGDIALRRNDITEATTQYRAALEQDNSLTAAYIGLGQAAGAEGNWSVAQGYFRDAVARNGDLPEAHLWLGEALIRMDNPRAAIDEYAQALKQKPDYVEAYFGLAQAQMALEQIDAADENLRIALRLRPNYAEARLLQGKLYEQQRRDDQALAAYGQAIEANRELAEPYYRRALMYIRVDRIEDAREDLESATHTQPNFPEAHYWLGRTYMAQGSANNALTQFKLAVEQRSGNYPEALFYQGLAEEQLGERSNAVTSFRSALEQSSDSTWASEARAALTRLGQR